MKRLLFILSLICCSPALGAVAFIPASHTICSQSPASNGTACTLPAPTTAGNLVIVGLTWNTPSDSINTVVGNATSSHFFPYAQVCNPSGTCSAILICHDCAALTTVTPNFAGQTNYNLSVEEYSGVSTIGVTRSATGTSATPGVTVTTGDANDWLVAVTGSVGNAGVPTPGSGNLRNASNTGQSNSDVAEAVCDNTSTSAGSLSCTATTNSAAWSAVGVELRTTFPTTHIWPDCDTAHPCVIHEKDTVSLGTGTDTLTGPFEITVPPTLPGNLMKLTISHPRAATITSIGDDQGNTWTTGSSTTDNSNAVTTEVRYVCGAATGTSVITVGFSQAIVDGDVTQFSYDEVSGIAPTACGDGGSGSSGGQGILNPGVITTTSNGDLVFTFGIATAEWVENGNQAGVAMPDDNAAKIAENDFDQFMSMEELQPAAGTINPTIYENAQDVNNTRGLYWNVVAQAFKAASGAGTQPTGIQVVTDQHFINWPGLGWNPLPSNGNAVVFSTSNPSAGWSMTNLADNYGTTYTRTPYTDPNVDPQQYFACLGSNISARDRIFSFTPDTIQTHVEIYTIAGAANATGSGCVGTTINHVVGTQGPTLNDNIVGDPVITPTINGGSNSVIFTTSYVGTGPPTGMCISGGVSPPNCTGQSAGVIFNSIYATGMTDQSSWSTGDPFAFFYTNSRAPRSMDYLMANGTSGTALYGAAIEIFGAAGSFAPAMMTPTVTVNPSASSITFSQPLSVNVAVSGGGSNPTPTGSVTLSGGGFSSTTAVLTSGIATIGIPAGSLALASDTLMASYTPDSSSSSTYNPATGTSSPVSVTQATPTVSVWPIASAITVGQTLGSSILSGGTASVSGTFAWTTPGTIPGLGTSSQSVTFTPTNTTDYTNVTGSVSVTANNATSPTVSVWPTASALTYGQTLASSALAGGSASVQGTFAWTTPSIVPSAGTSAESVTFTPTDTIDYNTVAGPVSLTVYKVTPSVSSWPTASPITYGQTLGSSVLKGGKASVPGSFAWRQPTAVPGAGVTAENVTFTPADSNDYNSITGPLSVTVNKATPTVSVWPAASAINYGQTLASSSLTGGTASVLGTFAWMAPTTAPAPGTPAESVIFNPADTADYNTVTQSVTVTVNKAAVTVSAWPAASAITYGQTLGSSTLTGGTASVAGSFAWTSPGTSPTAGTPSESVTFTPANAVDYGAVSGMVIVNVSKATPTVSQWPVASGLIYGQTLASSTLTGGVASVAGAFAWSAPSATPATGISSQSVTFTPADANDNNVVINTVSVTVSKATPTVSTWPTASPIAYGQPLAASTLSGGAASASGSFVWTNPTTAPSAGTSAQSVTFTPGDTTDFTTVTGNVQLTVNKATVAISAWPATSAITYGQTLASSNLTGGTASVSGTFAWTNTAATPGAGVTAENMTFTPTDASDYNSVTGPVSVTVNKATPSVSVIPTASAITYGQALALSVLSGGTASVSGSFTWTAPTTAPTAGTPSESVTFTPSDTVDYNTTTTSISITVNKASATVSAWPTASAITYGQSLSASTLTGGIGSVPGSFAWTTPGTSPGAGTPTESVTFKPTDSTDYGTVTSTIILTVNKATPTVSVWPTASSITYGQTLASSTLTGGTASVSGTFAWTAPSTSPGAGTASQSATFTPLDTTDFNSVTGPVSLTVNKATTPTITVWPSASAITYGQTLASSILTGGTASVSGTFAWTSPATAPKAGTPSESVTFTPSDTIDYNTATGSVSVTVNKVTPTISTWPAASAISYGQRLASSTLAGGAASVSGSFVWTSPTTSPSAGTPSESVTFTPTDTTDYSSVTSSVSVTVNKATPTVSAWPTASSINYGQTLASSTLTGGVASVSGGFAWTTPGTSPATGISSQSVTFTPSDTTDYNVVTSSVSVTVNKTAVTVSAWPTASAITYGQTLASSILSGGTASVSGTFAWTSSSTAPAPGTPAESVTFTPSDTTDYGPVTSTIVVTVNKATVTVSAWPTASAISYGQTLASSTLTGGTASVTGSFTWTTPGTAPATGISSQGVTFTPGNTTDYSSVTSSVSVTVNKATPTVSAWPTASSINYGQTLASSTLTGGTASVSGGFAWTTPGTSPATGTSSQSVTFTPSDTTDYNVVTSSVSVTVNKTAVTVSAWPTASAITYGQTLASSILSGGTASVSGTFAWTSSSTAPAPGTPAESVTFTPSDTTDYGPVTSTIVVTVNKATVTVSTWPTASAISYGQTLASSTLTGGTASVTGSFTWTTPGTAPATGISSQGVTFTPGNTTDYSSVTSSVSVTVNKATPTVSAWPTASSINYGQTLASSTLTGGTASVTGSFTWTTPGTSPATGISSQSVTFTPSDTTDYNVVTSSVSVTVNKTAVTVSAWPTASAITYGQTLASSILSGGTASVSGTFAWTSSSTAPAPGTPAESVTFTPSDTTDYGPVTSTIVVTVNKATVTVSAWPTASAISYGQTLASSTLTGGTASVTGSFTWTTPGTAPATGISSQGVTFTPGNTTDYSSVTSSVSVTVNKATPTVSAWPTASSINYGQTLASSTLTGGVASVTGSFTWTTPGTSPTTGISSQSVTFTPSDTTDYNVVTSSVSVTVNKTAVTVSAWPTASAITYGQTLASSILSGGTASVSGTFAWTSSSTAPAPGTPAESVTFTPSDTTDYGPVTSTIVVTVNKATVTVSTWPTASAISYGQTLASSTLTGGTASVTGSFTWTTPGTAPATGISSQGVTFTPGNTTDYSSVTSSVSVTVNKATPTVSAWPTASSINYGQTLASSTLTGGVASVSGGFAWTTPGTSPTTGISSQSVTFTPSDTTDYNVVTSSVSVTVNKTAVTVSAWPTASAITYGQTLASSILTGGTASVSGTFAWTSSSTAPIAGSASQSVTFTPADTTDYGSVTGGVSVTVNKATPTVSAWPTASAITYGQTLASSTLTGGTGSVSGSFLWSAPGTKPTAGTVAQGVTFTPTDSTDYNSVASSVSVSVNQASPIVTWPTPPAIVYGTPIGAAEQNATANVAGSFFYTTPNGTIFAVGVHPLGAAFMPTDTVDYIPVSAYSTITVVKATPTITWPTPAAINAGTALSATQLNATASVPGTFVYSPAAGSVPAAGTVTLSVTFTPSDSTDYNTATQSVQLTVNKASPPTVTTKAATNVGLGTATMNGTVVANNSTTQYWFIYGTSATSLTSSTAKTGAITGTTATSVSANLSGLGIFTTYYFEVVASNAGGTTYGTVMSFTP